MVAGLTASGLPTEEFHFAGFLPHKSGQRAKRLADLAQVPGTVVLYESPFRIERLVGELQVACPGREVVLARELTKRFEEWLRGTPESLAAMLTARPRKGEFVVMIAPEEFQRGDSERSEPAETGDSEEAEAVTLTWRSEIPAAVWIDGTPSGLSSCDRHELRHFLAIVGLGITSPARWLPVVSRARTAPKGCSCASISASCR
jgi:16S rRNA C1402 (ribose-2'-O) methylase RsmI